MRKNLKSKVLLSLLAASVFYLPAYANAAESLTINTTTTEEAIRDWLDGNDYENYLYPTKDSSGNTININGLPGFLANKNLIIYGNGDITEKMENNTISVGGAKFTEATFIFGASAVFEGASGAQLTLNNNKAVINGSTFGNEYYDYQYSIYGAYAGAHPFAEDADFSNITVGLTGNHVDISGAAEFNGIDIYGAGTNLTGADTVNATFTGNYVTVNANDADSTPAFNDNAYLYGAYADLSNTVNANAAFTQNYVTISGSEFSEESNIYGAYANLYSASESSATLTNNSVTISGGEFSGYSIISGAEAWGDNIVAEDNSVTISGGEFNSDYWISGAYIDGDKTVAEDNTVTISKAYLKGDDYTVINGGYADKANKNTVNITGGTFEYYAKIYGGDGYTEANENIVNISGTFEEYEDEGGSTGVYGGYSDNGTANKNEVNISGSTFNNETEIYGGNGYTEANENIVNISGAAFNNETVIFGGYAELSSYYSNDTITSSGNKVNISGGTFTSDEEENYYPELYGAAVILENSSNSTASLKNNSVTISGGTFEYGTSIFGAFAELYNASSSDDYIAVLENNSVTISGGTFTDKTFVFGAAVYTNGSNATIASAALQNNTVTLKGKADATPHNFDNLYLFGYYFDGNSLVTRSNNNLIVDGWSGTVGLAQDFNAIEFENISLKGNSEFNVYNTFIDNIPVNINSVAAVDYQAGTVLSPVYLNLDKEITYDNIKISDKLTNYENRYFASDYGADGVIANTFKELSAELLDKDSTELNDTHYKVKISATVGDTVLAGKIIESYTDDGNDANDSIYYNSNQTEDTASLTISKDLSDSSTNAKVVAGAYAVGSNDATGGMLIVDGGTVTKDLYAGYSESGTATGNTLTLTGTADVSGADLYGGGSGKDGANVVTGNTLTVDGWTGSVNSLQNFAAIKFENIAWEKGGTVLNITGNQTANALANTSISLNSLNFASSNIKEGGTMTLVTGTDLGIDENKVSVTDDKEFTAGVALVGTGALEVDSNNVKYTITSVGLNEQTDIVAETHAAAAAFLNQSTDLISDSLDVLGRDGSYGVKTFAAVQGNRSTYDVADDLKINGWSVIAGFGAENEHNGGDFAWGVFYENGSGNYRTYNTFNNEFFRGDGSMVYNGGGIAARYENAKGVYTEGSLRAGMLKNEMDNALRDASGASYGYETESTYYGAHIGVGQIFEIDENTDLDVYGKFFHTYTEGDSVTIGGDTFDFDHITSDRLRVGARVTKQQAKVNTYYGLAYEYEFNGDADMTAQGIKADTQSFDGGSGIAELGFNYQPGNDSPWNFDLNLRGYVGERQGGSFNVQATYSF